MEDEFDISKISYCTSLESIKLVFKANPDFKRGSSFNRLGCKTIMDILSNAASKSASRRTLQNITLCLYMPEDADAESFVRRKFMDWTQMDVVISKLPTFESLKIDLRPQVDAAVNYIITRLPSTAERGILRFVTVKDMEH